MKRTGWLKRSTEKARAWIERRSPLPKVNRKRKAKLHAEQFGPPGFGDFVRSRGCVVARQMGSVAGCLGPMQHCHRKSRAAGGKWRDNSFCACLAHHAEEHNMGQETFERAYGLDLDLEACVVTHQWDLREMGR